MKKILAILIVFITINKISLAQSWPSDGWPAKDSYITNNTMGAFHGTWQWINGTDTVKIYLTTQKVYYPINGGFYWDRIIGWHLYKKGNQIIESSFGYINTPYSNGHSTILGGNEYNSTVLGGGIKDITRNEDCALTLTLNTAQNKLTWYSTRGEGLHIVPSGQPIPPPGLTLPTQMVLTKL